MNVESRANRRINGPESFCVARQLLRPVTQRKDMFERLALISMLSIGAGMARGEVIVNHPMPPSPGNGSVSDTLCTDPFGYAVWQISADDFVLSSPATVNRVGWWGFYGDPALGQGGPNPPSGDETMRVRFYAARSSDGLPDDSNILYDESLFNVPRTWTGRWSGLRREWFFETDLSAPLALSANTPYWLEIAQIGDLDSLFVWETSDADHNGKAVMSANVPAWHYSGTLDLAVQLSNIPEPATAMLIALGSALITRRGRGGRC